MAARSPCQLLWAEHALLLLVSVLHLRLVDIVPKCRLAFPEQISSPHRMSVLQRSSLQETFTGQYHAVSGMLIRHTPSASLGCSPGPCRCTALPQVPEGCP